MSSRIKQFFKAAEAAVWTAANPLLKEGEPGFESDTNKMKVGDGLNRWNDLDYQASDKADISSVVALGETSGTAYRGDRGKTAYDHSQVAHAPSDADNTLNYLLGRDPKKIEDGGNIVFHYEGGIFTVSLSDLKQTLKDYFDTIYTPL